MEEYFDLEHKKLIEKSGEYKYICSFKRMTDFKKSRNYNKLYVRVKHIYCGAVLEKQFEGWEKSLSNNKKRGCCCGCYENSIAYYIECELGLNLYDIINMKKCKELGLDPYKISYCSTKKLWFLCLEKDYHNDEGGYERTCAGFVNTKKCPYCSSSKVHYKDSILNLYPKVSESIAIPENNLTLEDCAKIPPGRHERYFRKCLDCKRVSSKKKYLINMIRDECACEFCYDGVPITEKFFANILYQLKQQGKIDNYENRVQSNTLPWAKDYEYDFYAIKDSMTYIFETHGGQHYEENTNWDMTLEEQQENDKNKRELALNNNIDVYKEIDCRESNFDWLKENIIKEISPYFDLSNIDWDLTWKECQKSLVTKVCDLWNTGIYSLSDICDLLKLSKYAVHSYIIRGVEIGICNYTKEEAFRMRNEKLKGINNYASILYWVIKSDGEKYSDKPLCKKDLYNSGSINQGNHNIGLLNITAKVFKKYIEPYGNIDINRLKEMKATSKLIEKLTSFDGWKFIKIEDKNDKRLE